MKTQSSAATLTTMPLRVVYQQSFNEEQIRSPLVKVQTMKHVYGSEYRIHESVTKTINWDEAWFASYE